MCPRSSTARVMSMLRYIPRRSSRSSPASFTCCSVSTGSASRTAMWTHPFLGDGRLGLYRLARRANPERGAARRGPLGVLSPRELEVLGLMAEGRSNAGIAEALVLSESAVEKHIRSIFTKLAIAPAEADHRRVLA